MDDDEKIRELLSTRLSRKGHHVLTASYSQKDMAVFRRERSHVTILDFEMPNKDGLAVLGRSGRLIPALPLSVDRGRYGAREKRARELGVTDFLAKGFSLHEVGAALNQVLNQPVQGVGESPSSQRLSGEVRERT